MRIALIFAVALLCAPAVALSASWQCKKTKDEMTGKVSSYGVAITYGEIYISYSLPSDSLLFNLRNSILKGKTICNESMCVEKQKGRIKVLGHPLYEVEYWNPPGTGGAAVKFPSFKGFEIPREFEANMKAGNELWIEATTYRYTNKIYKVPLAGFTAAYEKCVAEMRQ